jgi:hypothetical protein
LRKALALKPGFKNATDALVRLGAPPDDTTETVIDGAGVEPWRVVVRSGRYFAVSDQVPRVSVPLEMLGEGKPKLLAWEVRPAPVKGIGVLRFHGGTMKSRAGAEDVELAAIVDLIEGKVIAIEPHKQGSKTSNWTWEQGRVIVASVDGVIDEFPLRSAAEQPIAGAQRRGPDNAAGYTGWAPWGEPWAGGFGTPQPRPTQRSSQKKKPKTLFDLLFN